MKITRILLILLFTFAFALGTFAFDKFSASEFPECTTLEKVQEANLPSCEEGTYYTNYFVYDYVRHTYLRVSESMYNNFRTLISSGDIGIAENMKYVEAKKQLISKKSGKVLKEEFELAKIGEDVEYVGEVYIYRYDKNKVDQVLRYVKRKKTNDDGTVNYLYYKVGYAQFTYLSNGRYTVDYNFLQVRDAGDKKNYEFIFYLRDIYDINNVLIGRQFNIDKKTDDYNYILNEDLKAREKWKLFSPMYNEETITGVIPEE